MPDREGFLKEVTPREKPKNRKDLAECRKCWRKETGPSEFCLYFKNRGTTGGWKQENYLTSVLRKATLAAATGGLTESGEGESQKQVGAVTTMQTKNNRPPQEINSGRGM